MSDRLRLGDRVVDLATGEVEGHGRLRPMERALLAFLALHADETVPIHELHAAVWGYAPQVRTRTAYSTVARLRAMIEPEPDNPRFVLAERGSGYRLVGATRVPSGGPPPAAVPSDPFVGRSDEIRVLTTLEDPVLILIGPGGAGKSRLALEAARHGGREGGWWWCNLEHARDDVGVLTAVAATLPGAQPDAGALGTRIASLGPCWIVLDDADRVGGPLAELVPRWVQAAPEARFTVTSRIRPWIRGERVIEVGPLPLPDALALYRDRLGRQAARSRDAAHDDLARALVDRVDRLPLGIEIVAGSAALVGPDGTLSALEQRRSLRNRSAGGRHGSLHAVVEGSWEHLGERWRDALADLAVLEGSFGMPAAEAALGRDDAVESVAALVDASLITVRSGPSGVSFRLFDIVRAFVLETRPRPDGAVLDRLVAYVDRLRPPPEEARRTHLSILTRSVRPGFSLPTLVAVRDRARALHPDAVEFVTRVGLGVALEQGRADLVRTWIDEGIAHGTPDQRAYLLLFRTYAHRTRGDDEGALRDYEAVLAGPPPSEATFTIYIRRYFGHHLVDLGRFDEAAAQAEAIAVAARSLPADLADRGLACANFLRSQTAFVRGDHEEAVLRMADGAAAARRAGDEVEAAMYDANRARNLLHAGRLEEAAPILARAIERYGLPFGRHLGWLLTKLAEVRRLEGRHAEAHDLAFRALPHQRSGSPANLCETLVTAVSTALKCGRNEEAIDLVDECLAIPPQSLVARVQQAMLRAHRAAASGPPWAATDLAAAARDLSDRLGVAWTRPATATLQAELLIASGELDAAARAVEGVFPADRSNDGRTCGLLCAELALRQGDRETPARIADQVLAIPAFPVERARAHGLRAVLASVRGDPATAEREIAHTIGVRGLGDGWLVLHREWTRSLRSGGGRDCTVDEVPPDELALRWAFEEARGPVPAWAR